MTIGWLALAILAGLMLVGRRHHLPRRLAIVTEIELPEPVAFKTAANMAHRRRRVAAFNHQRLRFGVRM